MPPRVFACLCHLIEHRDRVVTRDELIAVAWHRDNVSDIQLAQLVLRARRAVDDDGSLQQTIRTAVGFGYHWVAPTTLEPATADAPSFAPSDDAREAEPGHEVEAAGVPNEPPDGTVHRPPTRAASAARMSARSTPLVAAAAISVALAIVVGILGWRHLAAPPATPLATGGHIAVLPLDVPADTNAAWARLGGMDLIADRLRRSGLAVPPSESILTTLQDRPSPQASASDALLRRTLDADLVIGGTVVHDGDAWRVRLDVSMRQGAGVDVQARDADLFAALRTATDRLLAAFDRAPPADRDAGAPDVAEIAQRARAALLADDPVRAREVIDQAPAALHADSQLRFLRAQADARAGRFAAAEDAFTDLLATLSSADDPALRMRVLSARGLARIRVGRITDARRDFATALATPGADRWPVEFGLASNGRGITNAALHDFDAAAADFGAAREQMDRSGDVLGVARADANLGLLEYERGALAQAGTHLANAAQRFEPLGATRELGSALSGLELVRLALLDNRAALETSARLATQATHAGDPVQQRALLIRRAAALLANGHLRDAGAILDAIASHPGSEFHEARDDERVGTLLVELALREGRTADAARQAATLPSQPPPTGDDDLRAWSALLRQRLLGTAEAAGDAVRTVLAPPTPTARPLRALAQAEALMAAGHHDAADSAFRTALSLAEQTGVPRSIATVVASYAPVLLGQGRAAEAAALIGRTSVWADGDFDCALLQLRLAHADGRTERWRRSLDLARRLAGERIIPPDLAVGNGPQPSS